MCMHVSVEDYAGVHVGGCLWQSRGQPWVSFSGILSTFVEEGGSHWPRVHQLGSELSKNVNALFKRKEKREKEETAAKKPF